MAKVVKVASVVGLSLAALFVTASLASAQSQQGLAHRAGGARAVPEISAQGVPAGIALVLGGIGVVLGRRKRRAAEESKNQAR
jgi:hypothetical protein